MKEKMANNVIKVQNLGKKYKIGLREPYYSLRDSIANSFKKKIARNEFWALNHLNFSVKQGEVLGIIGPNGAGKSTLLKILSRITPPTTGKVSLEGRVASLLEVGTGFHPELTGRENIYLNGTILGMRRSEINQKFQQIIDFAEIHKFLDTPVKRYSSGMYVRLAFAVAANLEPEILLIDEVLAVGDASFQKKCLGRMQDVARGGRTVLFVSHNLGAVRQLCNHCILLKKGKIVASGTPQNVIQLYLGDQTVKSPVFTQKHDAAKKMNLRRVILNPQKKNASSNINYDEEIKVRIEYEINAPVFDVTVWLAVQDINGAIGFCTADFDCDPRMRDEREPGYYQSDVVLPGKWLNTGQYFLIVGLVQNSPLEVFDRIETINFKVIDNGTMPNSAFKDGTRLGILQPFLKWQNAKVK